MSQRPAHGRIRTAGFREGSVHVGDRKVRAAESRIECDRAFEEADGVRAVAAVHVPLSLRVEAQCGERAGRGVLEGRHVAQVAQRLPDALAQPLARAVDRGDQARGVGRGLPDRGECLTALRADELHRHGVRAAGARDDAGDDGLHALACRDLAGEGIVKRDVERALHALEGHADLAGREHADERRLPEVDAHCLGHRRGEEAVAGTVGEVGDEQPVALVQRAGGEQRRKLRGAAGAELRDRERGERHGDEQCRRGDGGHAVATEELSRAVARGIGPRTDRPSFLVALQVLEQPRRRRVAARRLLVHRREDDRVEVRVDARARIGAARRGGGPRGCGVAHHSLDLARREPRDAVRPLAGQQLVEQHAERVDVGRGRRPARRAPARAPRTRASAAHAGARARRVAIGGRVEQLRDAEVEQLQRRRRPSRGCSTA